MQKILSYSQFLSESIRAHEAYRDDSAIQTVLDGKRGVGFITLKTSPTTSEKEFWNIVETHGLRVLSVKGNAYGGYIYYLPGYEKQALELLDIAEKYGGYLYYGATEEDSRRIGELLGYVEEDIIEYLKKNYPSKD